jgi:hypothetical protein
MVVDVVVVAGVACVDVSAGCDVVFSGSGTRLPNTPRRKRTDRTTNHQRRYSGFFRFVTTSFGVGGCHDISETYHIS